MTEVEKLDAEIVAINAVIADLAAKHFAPVGETFFNALRDTLTDREKLLAAKRAAMKPTLLDCEDASRIYKDHCSNSSAESMDAVLTGCLERAYKVIEALPSRPVPDDEQEYVNDKLIKLSDIKSALLDGRSA